MDLVDEPAAPEVVMVEVGEVEPSPFQRRRNFPEDSEKEMAKSIAAHGVLQPVLMRRVERENPCHMANPDAPEMLTCLELVAGERRWRAAKRAGQAAIPAIFRELTDKEACEICLLENLQREDLTILEEAQSLDDLVELGFTLAEVSDRIGMKQTYITSRRQLLQLTDEGKAAVDDGIMSMKTAMKLLEVKEPARAEAFKRLQARGLEVGQLPQRAAIDLLQREFVSPQKRAADWEAAKEKVVAKFPDAEWQPLDAAKALAAWDSGHEDVEARPSWKDVTEAADRDRDALPTWGELASRHGAARKIMCEDWGKDVPEEELEGDEVFVVAGFRVMECVEEKPLKVAEIARCEEAGEVCVFRGGCSPEETEEEKEAAAAAATAKRAQIEARREEKRMLAEELLAGNLPPKKELGLAIWAWEHMEDGVDYEARLNLFAELLRRVDPEAEEEAYDVAISKEEKRLLAMMRKEGGGAALLGRVTIALCLADEYDSRLAEELVKRKLITKSGYPEWWAMGEAEIARKAEEEQSD